MILLLKRGEKAKESILRDMKKEIVIIADRTTKVVSTGMCGDRIIKAVGATIENNGQTRLEPIIGCDAASEVGCANRGECNQRVVVSQATLEAIARAPNEQGIFFTALVKV